MSAVESACKEGRAESPNHRFVVDSLSRFSIPQGARFLDYGCGAGEVVQRALTAGYDAYGVDVFYEGGSYREDARQAGLLGHRVREMTDGRAPFADGSFDVIVSNQVLEHVESLDDVVTEVARLLRPGGVFLALFPSRTVWREGHVGIPFLHLLPKHARWRVGYALAWRTAGFGYFKDGKSRRQWARDAVAWVDRYTYYRPWREIEAALTSRIGVIERLEPEYLAFRVTGSRLQPLAELMAARPTGRSLALGFVIRYAGLVLAASKR